MLLKWEKCDANETKKAAPIESLLKSSQENIYKN